MAVVCVIGRGIALEIHMADTDKLLLIANVSASYFRRNAIGVDQIGSVIASVTRALEEAAGGGLHPPSVEATEPATAEKQKPAVPVRRSVEADRLFCLECGKSATTLKRHLQSAHGLTPQQYREKWDLKRDYPMVARTYSERRSQFAKERGLGRKGAAALARRRKSGRRKKGNGNAGGSPNASADSPSAGV